MTDNPYMQSLQPRAGETVACIEIWKRPDVGFPSTFARAVRPKARVWLPEIGDTLVHMKTGKYAHIAGIREVTGEAPVFSVQFEEVLPGDAEGICRSGEYNADEFRERFMPKALPRMQFEFGPWEPIDRSFAKRALRLRTYTLNEFPGVTWAAKRFDGDRATQADYDRVLALRDDARAAKTASKRGNP